MNYTKLMNKIIFLLLLMMLFLLGMIFFVQYQIEKDIVRDTVNLEKGKLTHVYEYSTENLYLMYRTIGLEILNNKEVTKAVKNQNREKIIELTEKTYKEMKSANPFFHNMHFHTKNTRSIVRLHKPNKYGDDLTKSRPIIVAVNKQKTILHGVEVGKHSISFRLAFPVFHNKEHVGSLELGIKIGYLTNLFKNKFHTNSFFVFHNKTLDLLFEYSKGKIDYKTIGNISLFNYEKSNLFENFTFNSLDELLHKNVVYKFDDNNLYLSEVSKLRDYKNEPIGHIVFIVNVDKFIENINIYRITMVASFIVFGILLLLLLYKWFTFFINEVNKNEKKLEELSQTDELTTLFNRRKITELIDCEYDRSMRYKIQDTVIILDIDFFKKINDEYGHNIGDSVLQEISELLKLSIRKTDHLGRWGGEEFIIIATETSLEASKIFAENLRFKIESYNFKDVERVTCSFGISKLDTKADYKESIHNADLALYKAKEQGRNRVIVFED